MWQGATSSCAPSETLASPHRAASAAEEVLGSPYLLYEVLRRVEPADRLASVPLVCRAWSAASRWCWAELKIDGLLLGPRTPSAPSAVAFWEQLAAWVGARAPAIRSLRLHNLRHLLAELPDEQRREVVVAVAAALAPADALRQLDLGPSSVALGPGTLAGLSCLASLRSLTLHSAGPLDTAELDAVGEGLPQLMELSVALMRRRGHVCSFRGPFPRGLCRLRRLRRLRLEAPYSALQAGACTLPDAIADWGPQLRELHLINLGLSALPPAISALAGLEELCLARNRLGARHDSLPAELAELSRLRRLELQYNGFEWGPPAIVGDLPALEELNLSGNLWGSAAPDLPREYSQLSRLKFLTLTNCELGGLPPVVARLPSLLLLKLNINRIETLPSGPYLQALECLDLAHNRFAAGYPAALAGATRLQVISFQHRGVFYSNPAIALRDAIAPTAARHAVPAGNGTVPAVLVPAVAAPAAAVPGED